MSLAVMALLKRSGKFSLLGISVAGAVSHNIAQVLVAMAVMETARLAWYLPVLLVSGIAAGVCVGAAGALIVKRIRL